VAFNISDGLQPLPPLQPDFLDRLDLSLQRAFDLLSRGALDRRSAAHTPVFGSLGADGLVSMRTVVLRGFDREAVSLRLHTDRRSPKFTDLQREPRCSMLVYDPGHRIQLRIDGIAGLHTDDAVADTQWARTQPMSRLVYGVPGAPGSAIEDPGAATQGLSQVDEATQRAHFAVVDLDVRRIDWLYLSSAGNRRARFERDDGWAGRWCMP